MDQISESRLSSVHPTLASTIRNLFETLQTEGIIIRVTMGFRSSAQQAALYAQGRNDLDSVNQLRADLGWPSISQSENRKVTNASPGHSWHEFGLAVDVVPDLDTTDNVFTPDWNDSHPDWIRLVEVGAQLGLVNGKSWNDEPHFQLTGRFPVSPDDEVRQLCASGGIQAVWDASGLSTT